MHTGKFRTARCVPHDSVLALYSLALSQAGPVVSINLPESKDEARPKFGFCHYESVVSSATTCSQMKQILQVGPYVHLSAGVCKVCA